MNKDGSCYISYFWCIFHGARNRELWDLLERWIRKPHPRNESSKYAPTESSCHSYLCFGTRPRHQTRAPWLGPPILKKAKSNFFTNHNILHTLKNEPLNIMLLHTSRRALYFLPLPSTSCQWFLCFGTRPRHQTRAPCLGPPRLKKGKSYFLHNP